MAPSSSGSSMWRVATAGQISIPLPASRAARVRQRSAACGAIRTSIPRGMRATTRACSRPRAVAGARASAWSCPAPNALPAVRSSRPAFASAPGPRPSGTRLRGPLVRANGEVASRPVADAASEIHPFASARSGEAHDRVHPQWRAPHARRGRPDPSPVGAARRARARGYQVRLRDRPVRRLHGAPGRPGCAHLHAARRSRGRPRGHHHRGPLRGGRSPGAAGMGRAPACPSAATARAAR